MADPKSGTIARNNPALLPDDIQPIVLEERLQADRRVLEERAACDRRIAEAVAAERARCVAIAEERACIAAWSATWGDLDGEWRGARISALAIARSIQEGK